MTCTSTCVNSLFFTPSSKYNFPLLYICSLVCCLSNCFGAKQKSFWAEWSLGIKHQRQFAYMMPRPPQNQCKLIKEKVVYIPHKFITKSAKHVAGKRKIEKETKNINLYNN